MILLPLNGNRAGTVVYVPLHDKEYVSFRLRKSFPSIELKYNKVEYYDKSTEKFEIGRSHKNRLDIIQGIVFEIMWIWYHPYVSYKDHWESDFAAEGSIGSWVF